MRTPINAQMHSTCQPTKLPRHNENCRDYPGANCMQLFYKALLLLEKNTRWNVTIKFQRYVTKEICKLIILRDYKKSYAGQILQKSTRCYVMISMLQKIYDRIFGQEGEHVSGKSLGKMPVYGILLSWPISLWCGRRRAECPTIHHIAKWMSIIGPEAT